MLQARDKVLDEIVQEAKVQLGAVSSDPAAYEELVKNLVLQVRRTAPRALTRSPSSPSWTKRSW